METHGQQLPAQAAIRDNGATSLLPRPPAAQSLVQQTQQQQQQHQQPQQRCRKKTKRGEIPPSSAAAKTGSGTAAVLPRCTASLVLPLCCLIDLPQASTRPTSRMPTSAPTSSW